MLIAKRTFLFVSLLVFFASGLAFAESIAKKKVVIKDRSGKSLNVTLKEAALRAGVPERPLDLTFSFYDRNERNLDNKKFITIIDFRIHSSKDRLFLINTLSGEVTTMLVAHGKGSDTNHDGKAERFSNVPRSQASSLGFYQVSETYTGKHGYSVKLDGLSSTNSNARARSVVIHGADYVKRGFAKMGRSFGCPAVERKLATSFINKIKEGSLLFIYAPQFESAGLN